MRSRFDSRHIFLLLAGLSASWICVAGCSDAPAEPETGLRLGGVVRVAATGQVSSGAVVYLGHVEPDFNATRTSIVDSARTNSAGRFEFGKLGAGTYRVYAGIRAQGGSGFTLVSPFSDEIALTDKGDGESIQLSLMAVQEAGRITGPVAFGPPEPAPADSAVVKLYRFQGAEIVEVDLAYTSVAGQYEFRDVRTGNHLVAAVKSMRFVHAPFPVFASDESDPFFCNGTGLVQVDSLLLRELPVRKPAVYLYPESAAEVSVSLQLASGTRLTVSEPNYGQGWQVGATPDGLIDGRFDYLFYEVALRGDPVLEQGWCLAREQAMSELTPVLATLGFNDNETRDFVDYWQTRLPADDYCLIYPVFGDDLDLWVDLVIKPAPRSELRVWFFFQGSAEAVVLGEVPVGAFVREGFTVVEWGGAELAPRRHLLAGR